MAEIKGDKGSKMVKGRKSIAYLQAQKDAGVKLVQHCPGVRDQYWTKAADAAGVDICRLTTPGKFRNDWDLQHHIDLAPWWIYQHRSAADTIHINYVMETPTFATKGDALKYGSNYMNAGADSLLPMGITNDTLKWMSDNWLVVFGHVGALSGWQTAAQGGYKRHGKTAESAFAVFKMAYEYQENGMKAMTIELTPIEVSNTIAKKLRVPVISIAAGGECDGSEMVDSDLFGLNPKMASHAVCYASFFDWAIEIYAKWADNVRNGVYPEDKHGWHMDPVELEKFTAMVEKEF